MYSSHVLILQQLFTLSSHYGEYILPKPSNKMENLSIKSFHFRQKRAACVKLNSSKGDDSSAPRRSLQKMLESPIPPPPHILCSGQWGSFPPSPLLSLSHFLPMVRVKLSFTSIIIYFVLSLSQAKS